MNHLLMYLPNLTNQGSYYNCEDNRNDRIIWGPKKSSLKAIDCSGQYSSSLPLETPSCASSPKMSGNVPSDLQSLSSSSVGWSDPPSFVSSTRPSFSSGSSNSYFVRRKKSRSKSERKVTGLYKYFIEAVPTKIQPGMFPPNQWVPLQQ
ncbi:uncharacterized protein LOC132194352 [Neocloeon triangulifer]|uniref:uncharacterized protein LOC132194352 n=1 Tax=Neocloeon triangulifer TaxID=2078957 RepID=UPI00286F41BD|nr:uncharacterized protein LOC132194352 [Neocloeon triangulifer]